MVLHLCKGPGTVGEEEPGMDLSTRHDSPGARLLRAGGCGGYSRCGAYECRLAIMAPVLDVPGICQNAEEVRQNEPVLACVQSYDADNHAVDGGNYQSHPMFAANHDGGNDCKQAGNIIQMKHALGPRPLLLASIRGESFSVIYLTPSHEKVRL